MAPVRTLTRWSPPALPPRGQVGLGSRTALAAEILAAYAPLLRTVRTDDLRLMVATARTPVLAVRRTPADEARTVALRLGYMVERVLRVLPTDRRCLIQALVVLRVLAHRSIPAALVIGVRTDAGFSAHAWVEHAGRAILAHNGYTPVTRL